MRIGVVGAGKIGKLRVQSIIADPTAELAAVVDVNQQAAKAAVEGTSATAYSNLSAFLDTGMDAVIVSIPPHLHEDACVAAFARGLHVLCEKPLSNTVVGGQRIVDAAKNADRILAVGFNLRYYPFVSFARAAIDAGKIGKIDHIRIYGGHNGLHNFGHDWEYKMPESGGGAMMDIGIHMTDLARYFLGEITSVYGVMTENIWHVDGSEDNAMAVFRNPEGVTATYHATWAEWKGYKSFVEIYGDKGMVRGAYAPMQNLLISKPTTDGPETRQRKFYPEIMIREKLKTWQSTCLLSFQDELRDFQRMIAGNYDAPLADGHAGLRALQVAAAVRESTGSGQAVALENIGHMREPRR
ncbi:Gfo/Idh/MocA family protein [Ruegeria meonggei]|uniref:1,5-anhydro-D-fructose reductase n=1 Tax=Ruegeria meonggei TaxID=1446476 RepID=A0A1X7ACU4_9RHOB|nr:Gfo/Idh/MocA family oxidoreductase [Ruegeria meonggei]SLN75962.1 1,5-anhydro-D-fructose reductase [Ruegeria meonggei]